MLSQPGPATRARVRAAIHAAASLGSFFGVANPDRDGPGWKAARLLYDAGPGPLDDVIATARFSLGGCEARVAASLLFQGYAARLLSPQLGCMVIAGCVPAVCAERVSWRRPGTQLIELGLVPGTGWQGPADVLTMRILSQSFGQHLEPLSAALRARVRLAPRLLRDNAAAALVGALRLLDPHIEAGWRTIAGQALDHPLLLGAGAIGAGQPGFVRRSCCLYYRAASGSTCADCPLNDRVSARPDQLS